jgi:serine/threonine protein kinase
LLREPAKFGNYYLFERVNVGGMAEVFKGVSYGVEGFERLFAVKRVLPSISEDQEFIEMFIDEAKIAVQLNHPNIGQIFELGNAENSYFIAMEFVQGKDLRALFDRARKRGERLDVAMACHLIKEVCEALEYAHSKRNERQDALGLVHRDVSPQNILVSYDGDVKLIDFGIAKAAGKASKTQAGILKGKFGYMSPEQVRGRPIDRRSDLFSLGVVLFEMLTLERCFQGESDFSTLEKVRNVDIRRPSTLNREITPELERILLKALSRNPDERYQSASELQDALQKYLYQSGAFFARKDLAQWMKRMFEADLLDEQRRMQAFRAYARENIPEARRASSQLNAVREPDTAPGHVPASSTPAPTFKPKLPTLSWEEDELETSVWDQKPSDIGKAPEPPPGRLPLEPAFTAELNDQPLESAARPDPHPSAAFPRITAEPTFVPPEPATRSRVLALMAVTLIALIVAAVFVLFTLSGQPATPTLVVKSTPTDVTISVDEQILHQGATPFTTAALQPGRHQIKVSANGYESRIRDITLEPGRELVFEVELQGGRTDESTALEVDSVPRGARVKVDGVALSDDVTPLTLRPIAPGDHEIRVEKDGYQPWVGQVTASAGKTARIEQPIILSPSRVTVRFMTEPAGARVSLELPSGQRQFAGQAPVSLPELDNSGQLVAIVEQAGFETQRRAIGPYAVTVKDELIVLQRSAGGGTGATQRGPSQGGQSRGAQRAPEEDAPTTPPAAAPTEAPTAAPAAVAGTGFLNVISIPPATIYVNGEALAEGRLYKHPLSAGSYQVVLLRESDPKSYRREFTAEIRPDDTSTIKHAEP